MTQPLKIYALTAALLLFAACSDETDAVDPEADAGEDVEQPAPGQQSDDMPTADSIDPDDAEPAGLERIYVESADSAGVISDDAPLRAQSYFDADQAAELIGDDDLEPADFAGQSPSPGYNAIRFHSANDEDSGFGTGLQIWDLDGEDLTADERLEDLRSQFLGVSDVDGDELTDGAFVSERGELRTLVFTADTAPYVFALTCDLDTCETVDELVGHAAGLAASH